MPPEPPFYRSVEPEPCDFWVWPHTGVCCCNTVSLSFESISQWGSQPSYTQTHTQTSTATFHSGFASGVQLPELKSYRVEIWSWSSAPHVCWVDTHHVFSGMSQSLWQWGIGQSYTQKQKQHPPATGQVGVCWKSRNLKCACNTFFHASHQPIIKPVVHLSSHSTHRPSLRASTSKHNKEKVEVFNNKVDRWVWEVL